MLKETADFLLSQGNQVDLLLVYRSESNTYLSQLDKRIGVHYIWDVDHKSNLVQRMVFWLNVLFPGVAASRASTREYDWVINFKDAYQTNLIASRFKTKKISWIHNITEDYHPIVGKSLKYRMADRLYRVIERRYLDTFSAFDKVVCVSKHAQSTLEAHCRNPIRSTVLYNYVDNQAVCRMAQEPVNDVSFDRFTYCYVGRLSAEKGVAELTEIVCKLIRSGENAQLLIIGEGYQLEELKQISAEYGCSDRVLFLGTRQNPYPYLAGSDVILCASHKESFGLVVLESILLKRWIVSTRCGGPEELIRDGENGFLVNDYNEFMEKLEWLYQNRVPVQQTNMKQYQELQEQFFQGLNRLLISEV